MPAWARRHTALLVMNGVEFLQLHSNGKGPSAKGQRRRDYGTVRKRPRSPGKGTENRGVLVFFFIVVLSYQCATTSHTNIPFVSN